jgi:multiple sugar transport system permease protein
VRKIKTNELKKTPRKLNKKYLPVILLAPAFLFYILFWLLPVLMGFYESLTTDAGQFTFNNFRLIFMDGDFGIAILNTGIFVVISILIQYVLALIMALILNMNFRFRKVLTFLVMIPMAITPTAVAIIWKTGLRETGWINSILMQMHLTKEMIPWLESEGFNAILMLVTIDTWTVLPSIVIILLAGLQNLNKEVKEAGAVFGASRWQVLKDIVIPILKPSIITSLLLRIIAATQIWVLVVMVMGFNSLPFMVERIAYYVDFVPNAPNAEKMAYAMSIIVSVIIFITSVLYYKVAKKNSVMEVDQNEE